MDNRLKRADAQVRLPRSFEEALTDVRYFAAQGYRVIVAVTAVSSAAARTAGAPVVNAPDATGALAAAAR